MRVLICGGAGFIGTSLARRMWQAGFDVHVADNEINLHQLPPSIFERITKQRREILRPATFHKVDLCDRDQTRRLLESLSPRIIIHAANLSIASIAEQDEDQAKRGIYDVTLGVLNELQVARPDRFVYLSSSMVYGHFTSRSVHEETPLKPINRYGFWKSACENKVIEICGKQRIPYTIVRPIAVYGPLDGNGRVISRLFLAGQSGAEFPLRNESSVLNLTYVDDVVEGVFLATTRPEGNNQIFNIASEDGPTLRELIAFVKKRYFPDLKISSSPSTRYEPHRTRLDIRKAGSLIGYKPAMSLLAGLDSYYEWHKSTFS